jgi:hypothetical protein
VYNILFVVYLYVLDRILENVSHFGTMKLCLDVEIQCRYKRLLWVSCVDECMSLPVVVLAAVLLKCWNVHQGQCGRLVVHIDKSVGVDSATIGGTY